MTDPIRARQLDELEDVELCVRILSSARNELYDSSDKRVANFL